MRLTPGDNGYVEDLLRRMQSDEMLPQPESDPVWSNYSVSWLAHREAERLEDLSLLPRIAERVETATRKDLIDLAFARSWLVKNTGSKDAEPIYIEVAEKAPSTPIEVHSIINGATRAKIRECRDYVLRHLDTNSSLVLLQVVDYLGEMGDEGDIPTLGTFLDAVTRGLKCGGRCAAALRQIGGRAALPYQERAAQRHRKARKRADIDTRIAAEFAIAQITRGPEPPGEVSR